MVVMYCWQVSCHCDEGACCTELIRHVWLGDLMDCSLPNSSVHGFSIQEHWRGLPCSPWWRIALILPWLSWDRISQLGDLFPSLWLGKKMAQQMWLCSKEEQAETGGWIAEVPPLLTRPPCQPGSTTVGTDASRFPAPPHLHGASRCSPSASPGESGNLRRLASLLVRGFPVTYAG